MEKSKNNISILWNYFFILAIFFLLHLPFLDSVRRIIIDENWYSNVAYNFSEGKGFINTNVGSGGGTISFLYPIIEGFFFYLFGTSLFTARFVSLISGVLSVIGILKILRSYKIDTKIKYFAVLLLMFSYNYFLVFRFARPEGWVCAIFVWMVYFHVRYELDNRISYIFFQGLLAGLSFFIHPWGTAFIILFGIYCLYLSATRKDYRILAGYAAGAVPVFIILLGITMALNKLNLESLILIFSDRTIASENSAGFIGKIIGNFESIFERYGLKGGRTFIIIFHALISIYGLSFFRKNRSVFALSALQILLLLISVLVFSGGGMEFMLHFIFIFTFINLALILNDKNTGIKLKAAGYILGIIFLINNAAGIVSIVVKEHGDSFGTISKKIEAQLQKSSIVIGPMEMWFPCRECEFYNTNTMWSFAKYKDLRTLLESGNLEYIIAADGVKTLQTQENLQAIERYISERGKVIQTFRTENYGMITIWRVKN